MCRFQKRGPFFSQFVSETLTSFRSTFSFSFSFSADSKTGFIPKKVHFLRFLYYFVTAQSPEKSQLQPKTCRTEEPRADVFVMDVPKRRSGLVSSQTEPGQRQEINKYSINNGSGPRFQTSGVFRSSHVFVVPRFLFLSELWMTYCSMSWV